LSDLLKPASFVSLLERNYKMQKIRSVIASCISIVSIASCASVFAMNKAGDITLNVGGGYDIFSSRRHIENSGVPTLALGYNFTDQWGIEGLFGAFNTNSKANYNNGKHVNGWMFAVDGLYHFTPYQLLQPYVFAGPGLMSFNPNGNDANNQGNINAGAGLQFFVADMVALRLEARDIYTFVGGYNDVFLNGGVTIFFRGC
jgi:OOP family OmpA-OmpF porin